MTGSEPDLGDLARVLRIGGPVNPRREADMLASLQAFDALYPQSPPTLLARLRGKLASWQLKSWLIPAGALAASSALVLTVLPRHEMPQPLDRPSPPPELRLSLPEEPISTAARDARIMAPFEAFPPRRFEVPWDSDLALIWLPEGQPHPEALEVLLGGEGQVLGLIPRTGAEPLDPLTADQALGDYAVAMAGLALLARGVPASQLWPQEKLRAQADRAATGMPLRQAALAEMLDRLAALPRP